MDTRIDLQAEEPLLPTNTAAQVKQSKLSTQAFLSKLFSNFRPSPAITTSSNQPSFLRRVVVPSAIESSISMSFALACSRFLKPGAGWLANPITQVACLLTANAALRLPDFEESGLRGSFIISRGIFFSIINLLTRGLLTHEAGHALAAISFFENANPRIELNYDLSNSGGKTYFNPRQLNERGEAFGRANSLAAVSAAGTGAGLLVDFITLILAQAIPDQYPEIKNHLRLAVIMELINNIAYALSECTSGNDFCSIEKEVDISPAICVVAMVGSLLLLQLTLSCFGKCRKSCKETLDENGQPRVVEVSEEDDEIKESNEAVIDIEPTRAEPPRP